MIGFEAKLLTNAALGLLLGTAVAVGTPAAGAQEAGAPSGPIEVTVPSSAGSTPDVLMRRMGQIMNENKIVENPIVIVNRAGGAWTVGMNYVLDRAGDKNNVISLAEPIISTPIAQGQKTAYDRLKPLGIFVQTQLVVVAQPDHKANTLSDLVKIAKENPRVVKVSGANPASTDAQVAGLIQKAAGVQMTYIPHDGGGAAQATFLGGNTDIITLTIDEALPLIKSKKGKALAILNENRRPEPELKDIPTAREQGIDVVWGQIFGLSGAPNLDAATVAWWDDKIGKLVQTEEWKAVLSGNFLGGDYLNSEQSRDYLAKMHESRLNILRQLGASKL
jgi:putative tricarboxylic transport membrane protein